MMNQANTETIPVDLQALKAWMDDIGLERGPLSNLQLLAGGTQNILLRFDIFDSCQRTRVGKPAPCYLHCLQGSLHLKHPCDCGGEMRQR